MSTIKRKVDIIEQSTGGFTSSTGKGIGNGFKNLIINGGFDVWQRGTTFSASASSNIITADRWQIQTSGGVVDKVVATIDGVTNAARMTATDVTPQNNFTLVQAIENAEILRNKTVTLSVMARGTATNIKIGGLHVNGDNGATNGAAGTLSTTFLIDETWKRYSVTVNIGELSTEVYGPNSYTGIYLQFGTINQTEWVEVAEVQLELGSVATPFEQRPYGLELSLCQRYYQKNHCSLIIAGCFSSTRADIGVQLPVTMRTVPTTSVISSGSLYIGGTSLAYGSFFSNSPQLSSVGFTSTDVIGATTGHSGFLADFIFTADAEL